ncbi:hypothetical protein HPP92_012936 [Vanilla planifolia]|uniref:Uncharacterized protein n=1 Tax=Vanilla planifolia TaxID=51239 RepID=A0A835R101_VANPL|nr:hypothetical protein HPP92_012936 [Vanilla planifolia]
MGGDGGRRHRLSRDLRGCRSRGGCRRGSCRRCRWSRSRGRRWGTFRRCQRGQSHRRASSSLRRWRRPTTSSLSSLAARSVSSDLDFASRKRNGTRLVEVARRRKWMRHSRLRPT